MYIIVNENPASFAETPVCSSILKTWNEALTVLAELRAESKNTDLHIYHIEPSCTNYENLTVSFDANLWEWHAGAAPGLFQCKLRDAHKVDMFELANEED